MGSGGEFLKTALACCTKNSTWVSEQRINFHKSVNKVLGNHWSAPAQNIISIDSPDARYNFWVNYFRKKVIYELTMYRHQGKRWIKGPSNEFDIYNDSFWLLNQSRFIINYQSLQRWKINWIEMMEQPDTAWRTIQEFLDANNQPNHWNIDQWVLALDDYKQTLPKQIKINTHHLSWQIWAVALLQEQGITPPFNLIANFKTLQFFEWLNNYKEKLVETTQKCTWNPG